MYLKKKKKQNPPKTSKIIPKLAMALLHLSFLPVIPRSSQTMFVGSGAIENFDF